MGQREQLVTDIRSLLRNQHHAKGYWIAKKNTIFFARSADLISEISEELDSIEGVQVTFP
jgi:hypothetical protein